jgi:AcrR family transcriptional regulator
MPKIVDHNARRRELVEASWAVIATEGLEGVTMRKVAEAAGCTTGRITHYFADREALILASLQTSNLATSTRVNDIINSDLDAHAKLLGMANQTLPLDEERRIEVKVWLAFWSAATINNTLAKENDARMEEWFDALLPLVEELAPNCDATHEANLLIGLINGLGIQAAVNPSRKNLSMAKETVEKHLKHLIDSNEKGTAQRAAPKSVRDLSNA